MNTVSLRLIVLLILAFLALPSADGAETSMREDEAIKLANEAAKKAGWDLGRYDAPKAKFTSSAKGGRWLVSFLGKADEHGRVVVGRHFGVSIDEQTRKIEIHPGR